MAQRFPSSGGVAIQGGPPVQQAGIGPQQGPRFPGGSPNPQMRPYPPQPGYGVSIKFYANCNLYSSIGCAKKCKKY